MAAKFPVNIDGFRAAAARRLPRPVFDFVDGGAEDETTQRGNEAEWKAVYLWPRVLTDLRNLDLSTTVCGVNIDLPIITSPTGLTGVVHPDGELGALRAATKAGTVTIVSSSSTYSIE